MKVKYNMNNISYPQIALIDNQQNSQIVTIFDETNQKILMTFEYGSIEKSLSKFAEIIGQKDIFDFKDLGDATIFKFDFEPSIDNKIINFDKVIEKLNSLQKLKLDKNQINTTKKIQDQLNQYSRYDQAASTFEIMSVIIIYHILQLASELSINSVGFYGNIAKDLTFQSIFNKLTETIELETYFENN
jgi:hypothetical protein